MNDNIQTKIIVPQQLKYDITANKVILPGQQGEFTILPQHTNLVARLITGVIFVYSTDKKRIFYIDEGIVEVDNYTVKVFTNYVIDVESITSKDIEKILQTLLSLREKEFYQKLNSFLKSPVYG